MTMTFTNLKTQIDIKATSYTTYHSLIVSTLENKYELFGEIRDVFLGYTKCRFYGKLLQL